MGEESLGGGAQIMVEPDAEGSIQNYVYGLTFPLCCLVLQFLSAIVLQEISQFHLVKNISDSVPAERVRSCNDQRWHTSLN